VSAPALVIGRYALFSELASGGMATVYIGRLLGPVGFSRTVAIKRLHPTFARDPEFVAMFLDEARLAARIRHPNVVPTLDVVATQGELFLVMEYVQGESLSRLVRAASKHAERTPPRIASSIVSGALLGLHAAHEARDERGIALGLVHRDVSPQNVLVGSDGIARVLDFGVAKAVGRVHTTREGQIKGKLGYMAPEQLHAEQVTRQADIYAAAVVLWEALTGRKLFTGDSEAIVIARIVQHAIDPPSKYAPEVSPELDAVVMKGLAAKPVDRYATAREMALALEKAVGPVSIVELADWVEHVAGEQLATRAGEVAAIESQTEVPSTPDLRRVVADMSPTPTDERSATLRQSSLHSSAPTAIDTGLPGLPRLRGEPPSQVSSVSVSKHTATASPSMSRVRVGVFAGAVVAVAAAALVLVSRGHAPAPAPTSLGAAAPPAVKAAAPVALPPPVAPSPTALAASPADASVPVESLPSATPAPHLARPSSPAATAKPRSPFDIIGPSRE